MKRPSPPCLVCVHDVMPETIDRTAAILQRLEAHGVPPCTLLVVPGKPWAPASLDTLRQWSAQGHRLAAHGWRHHVAEIRGWQHRLHAALISRHVAEHLALDSTGIRRLLEEAHAWFALHGLPAPSLYVPPAWALGAIRGEDLAAAPYRQIEVMSGLLSPATGRLLRLPLVGFEADTRLRAAFLRRWNARQRQVARQRATPLRLSIHPDDFELHLADQLEALLREDWSFLSYEALAEN